MLVKMRGEEVRALREERDLTREEFAREAGIARSTVERVEGGRTVRLDTARKVAGTLEVEPTSVAWAVHGEHAKPGRAS